MAKCPSCGANVNASDKRCSKCGAKLDNQKSKTDSSKLIIGIIIVVVIIAVIGAFASGIFTNNDATTQSDDSSVETVEPITEDSKNGNSDSDESADTEYWASEKTDKFHLPDCEWAEKISADNKIIYDTREDAIADGKEPCGVCNP